MLLHTERVEREDLVLFINACFACTGQDGFHGGASDQRVAIGFLHEYILGNYRRLYARTLAAGINHFNQALIIANLLAAGAPTEATQRREEGDLIAVSLGRLPPPRVYRLFAEVRTRRVNNRRTRAVARDYLATRDLAFDAVKYRNGVRDAAAHAHLELPGETGTFVFVGARGPASYATPAFETWRAAHHSRKALFQLPFSVARGLAAHRGVGRDELLTRGAARMTAVERLRAHDAAERAGVTVPDVDLARVPLTRLALYVLSRPADDRRARCAEYTDALDSAARNALRRAPGALGRVAAVLDRSRSASGSREKQRRPLAIALGASALLRVAARDYRAFWTSPVEHEILVDARGQTDLATPLLDALAWGAELVVIVSDGAENAPAGATREVTRSYRAHTPAATRASIVHVNPVFDAETFAPRTLGDAVPTVGLRDAEDLLTVLGFARFADGSTALSELEAYLAARVRDVLASNGVRS